ncbi:MULTISPECIES: hypothetical protein [unclassified Aeromonas]|uniref:hypothetical protein n=1 Tax=unclassified Aeromonas TaxID=257493 RepID=UPI0022E29AEA|nr:MULTISPECIES: hypothetical protein [unclassified Aeromonas]
MAMTFKDRLKRLESLAKSFDPDAIQIAIKVIAVVEPDDPRLGSIVELDDNPASFVSSSAVYCRDLAHFHELCEQYSAA